MTQNATPEHDGFDEIKYRNSFAKPSTPPNDWADRAAAEINEVQWCAQQKAGVSNQIDWKQTSEKYFHLFAASEARATAAEKRCAELMHELNRLVPVLGEVDAEIVQGLLATKTAGKGGAL